MATTEKLLTAEEFEQLPDDGKRYELIDGELREMAPTVNWHGEVEMNLARFERPCPCPGARPRELWRDLIHRSTQSRPRAGRRYRLHPPGAVPPLEARQHIMEVIPDLVVEILSKSDTIEEVSDKIDDWLGAGVKMLWVVDPFRRTVTIYQPGHDPVFLGERATLEGDPIVPGFRCSVAEIFA